MSKKPPQPKESNIRGARPILVIEDVCKSYKQGDIELPVLNGASFEVYKGEMVSLVGESGCGKSTLLHICGLLDNADSGMIKINDIDCSKISARNATKIRRDEIGFVYQNHHLLQEFSAAENVMMPQLIAGISKKQALEKAEFILEKVGLKDRISHRPYELSGGEQQRTAIARALANDPAILLADEPTGNLDPETSKAVFDVLIEYVVENGLSMFIVTHNHHIASKTDRTLTLEKGNIVPIKVN